jgi:hypothetical protein
MLCKDKSTEQARQDASPHAVKTKYHRATINLTKQPLRKRCRAERSDKGMDTTACMLTQ